MGPGGNSLVVAADIRLAEQAHALIQDGGRRFRRVPGPAATEQLRIALLALPERAEPLEWLGSDAPALAAEVTLTTCVGIGRELAAGPPIPDPAVAFLLGRLATATSDPGSGSPKVVLAGLREISGLEPSESPELSVRDPAPMALLADLLRLPAAIDAAAWLQRARPRLSARLALTSVLDQTLPIPQEIARSPIQRRTQVEGRCSAGRRLIVRLRTVSEHADGFVLDLDVRFEMPSVATPSTAGMPGDPAAFTTWDGFERVTDSEGRRYATWPMERGLVTSPWPWERRRRRERLTMVCAPSIIRPERGPTRLILESPNAALSAYRATPAGELISIGSPALGPLRCKAELPT